MSFFKLAVLYTLSILFCGRAGLLLHEMVGHGLVAKLLGAQVTSVELHWFGGGSVHFQWSPDFPAHLKFFIYFGGIFIELLIAGCLWIWCRKRHIWIAELLACVLFLHSLFYWATSTQGHFGDGRQLQTFIPLSNTLQLTILTGLFWQSCFLVARRLWNWSHGLHSRKSIVHHLLLHGGAVSIAVLVHGGLSYSEFRYFNSTSPAHQIVFKPEHEFTIDQLRKAYVEEHQQAPNQQWESEKEEELQPWPHYSIFMIFFGTLFGLMGIRYGKTNHHELSSPSLTPVAIFTSLTFALIWVIKFNSL